MVESVILKLPVPACFYWNHDVLGILAADDQEPPTRQLLA